MKTKYLFHFLKLILLASAVFSFPAHAANSIVAVDINGVGQYTSLAIDSQGDPIISYYNATQAKLKVVHCFDKNCSTFNAILTPDAASQVGKYTSLALDHNGNPVVSYYDTNNTALKVLHCGNSSCSTGNTVATPDAVGNVGQYTAVTVDSKNFPVVSYYDVTTGILKILHCGNAACSANNVIVTPDTATSNGVQSSIKLNAAGNPVVAYFDFTKKSLKILRCGNANCTAGNNIVTADSGGDVGRYPAMIIGSNGNPFVSYLDSTNGNLKILHCGNAACSAGNTLASAPAGGFAGYFSSLALGANGFPVVSFYNRTNGALNVLRCGNAACSSGNTITVPDSGQVGEFTSLALDTNGDPVVSYYDNAHGNLKVLHCDNLTCNPNSDVTADPAPKVGQYTSLRLDANGKPVVSYWDETNGHLRLLHCGDANCAAGNNIAIPAAVGNTGWDTSLVLDASGNPVVSFYDFSNSVMNVLHCGSVNCTGTNSITKPDPYSQRHTSIALDSVGHPVVASAGPIDQGLRVVHCGDVNCSANNTLYSPDIPAYPFSADVRGVSLVLDAAGNPVVSYYRADKVQMKVLHCVDPACAGNNTIAIPDVLAQASDHNSTSIFLDAVGNPIVAYQDMSTKTLKVLHCGTSSCTAGNTIATIATGTDVGFEPSVKTDSNGYPVVSYGAPAGLTVVHCGNAACTAGNTITVTDAGIQGADTSLALDASGNPVVSYYDAINSHLKVLHCAKPNCQ